MLANQIQNEVSFFESVKMGEKWLLNHSKVVKIAGVKGIVKTENPQKSEIIPAAIRKAESSIINEEDIMFSFGYDDRDETGETRSLFRTYNAGDSLDFSKLSPENLVFKHKGGFLIKFKEPYDLSEMIRLAKV